MKRLVALLLFVLSNLAAQQEEIQSEACAHSGRAITSPAKSLFESLLAVDPRNPAARTYLRAIAVREGSGPTLLSALRKINIPTIDFRDVSVREAVAFVAQKVHELSGGERSFNVVWMVPPETTARQTRDFEPAERPRRRSLAIYWRCFGFEVHLRRVCRQDPAWRHRKTSSQSRASEGGVNTVPASELIRPAERRGSISGRPVSRRDCKALQGVAALADANDSRGQHSHHLVKKSISLEGQRQQSAAMGERDLLNCSYRIARRACRSAQKTRGSRADRRGALRAGRRTSSCRACGTCQTRPNSCGGRMGPLRMR